MSPLKNDNELSQNHHEIVTSIAYLKIKQCAQKTLYICLTIVVYTIKLSKTVNVKSCADRQIRDKYVTFELLHNMFTMDYNMKVHCMMGDKSHPSTVTFNMSVTSTNFYSRSTS